MKARIAVLGGDGVGPEVMAEALRCLEKLAALFGQVCDFFHGEYVTGISFFVGLAHHDTPRVSI